MIFVPAIGIYHQAKVYIDQTNAEIATASAFDATYAAVANATVNANDATATVVASLIGTQYNNRGGTPALYDPLNQSLNWSNEFDTHRGSCTFMSDGYHIVASQNNFYTCDATSRSFDNFVFEVKMTIIQGDCGGMDLRFDPDTSKGYGFFVCSDGTYDFNLDNSSDYFNNLADNFIFTKEGHVPSLESVTSDIAVVASGSNFGLYLNNTLLVIVSDSTYIDGDIGLIAYNQYSNTNRTEVIYNDARVWQSEQ